MIKQWIIHKLGGYASLDDAISAIVAKELPEREKILTLAVKRLYNTIGYDDILKKGSGGEYLHQGKTLSKAQINVLIAEAAQLQNMTLWKVLKNDILYQVNKKMYLLSENQMHVATAKFWLYSFDVMNKRIEKLSKGDLS